MCKEVYVCVFVYECLCCVCVSACVCVSVSLGKTVGPCWKSWITMAGVQGWLIVSDTQQF